ncbi:MAG: SIR2 family protein [Gammaproteobacteria bacterium]|nr:SIR2 family protein [Gammaproteobacteria bacterium]
MRKKILLTGAGFTCNFGGFLAKDMWGVIFNNAIIQNNHDIRKKMLKNYDFESLYEEIRSDKNFTKRDEFINIVKNAYSLMDDQIKSSNPRIEKNTENEEQIAPILRNVFNFIARFAPPKSLNETGYFFTLNQDLFVEYLFQHHNQLVLMPAINSVAHKNRFKLNPNINYYLPSEEILDAWIKDFLPQYNGRKHPIYIKLHGSYTWKYSESDDDIMVLGGQKKNQIQKEPLLKYQFELFKDNIATDADLMIIGYGFRDKHVNKILLEGCGKGLRLHIINPCPIDQFKNYLHKENAVTKGIIGEQLYTSIYGYYNCNLIELLSNTNNPYYLQMQNNFFASN